MLCDWPFCVLNTNVLIICLCFKKPRPAASGQVRRQAWAAPGQGEDNGNGREPRATLRWRDLGSNAVPRL